MTTTWNTVSGAVPQSLADQAATSATNAANSASAASTSATAAETAKTAAEAAQLASETAETNSATSASQSASSATNSATSASQSASSATSSAASAAAALVSEGNAATSEASAQAADTSATAASASSAASALTAAAEAAAALASQNSATSSASAANTSATNAANSAVASAASEAASAASEAAAASSEAAAAASEAAAAASEAAAAASEAAAASASTSATNSAASASGAAANAATSAANASTSEANASTSEGNASTSASNAATSATAAAGSATSASNSASSAAADLATFQGQYHGASGTAPTTGLDVGDLWFDTSGGGAMKVYNGSAWVAAYISSAGMLAAANNLSDVSSASSSRTNLGLGTMATQAATSVDIDGGAIDGVTIGAGTPAAVTATSLTATDASVVSVSSASDALRITQTGTGNALVVEDSTNPDSTPFVIDASGNAGIGITAPLTPLHVKGNWVNSKGILQIDANSGQTYSGLTFQNNGTVKAYLYHENANDDVWFATSGTGQDLIFASSATSDERMRIQGSSGRVGIGVTSPSGLFHVEGSVDGSVSSYFRNGSTGSNAYSAIHIGNDASATALNLFINSSTRSADGGANVATVRNDIGALRLQGSGSAGIHIASSGFVGIGGTPAVELDIIGNKASYVMNRVYNQSTSAGSQSMFSLQTGSANHVVNIVMNDNTGSGYFQFSSGAGVQGAYHDFAQHFFRSQGGGTTYAHINSTGMGIGRTPTTNKLEVDGTIESTSGGYKFPDGSTQSKSAGHGLSAMIALGMA